MFQMFAEVVGGLGLFLLGMKNMSDGMQAIAGSSLRRMIGAVTDKKGNYTLTGVPAGTHELELLRHAKRTAPG